MQSPTIHLPDIADGALDLAFDPIAVNLSKAEATDRGRPFITVPAWSTLVPNRADLPTITDGADTFEWDDVSTFTRARVRHYRHVFTDAYLADALSVSTADLLSVSESDIAAVWSDVFGHACIDLETRLPGVGSVSVAPAEYRTPVRPSATDPSKLVGGRPFYVANTDALLTDRGPERDKYAFIASVIVRPIRGGRVLKVGARLAPASVMEG